MRISDWSSDVCSSDLDRPVHRPKRIQPFDDEAAAKKGQARAEIWAGHEQADRPRAFLAVEIVADDRNRSRTDDGFADPETQAQHEQKGEGGGETAAHGHRAPDDDAADRSEERRVGKEGGSPCRSRWSP